MNILLFFYFYYYYILYLHYIHYSFCFIEIAFIFIFCHCYLYFDLFIRFRFKFILFQFYKICLYFYLVIIVFSSNIDILFELAEMFVIVVLTVITSLAGRWSVLYWRPLLWEHQPLHKPPVWPQPHPRTRVHAAPGPALPSHRLLQLQRHFHGTGARVRPCLFISLMNAVFNCIMILLHMTSWLDLKEFMAVLASC